MQTTLRAGQPVLFVSRRHRTYYAILEPGGETNFSGHRIAHDDVIGQPDGVLVHAHDGRPYDALSATLSDHALQMRRGPTIIYPKDTAEILLRADIYPGATVLECGLGSGAMATALLRAVGPTGRVVSYEIEASARVRAQRNIEAFLGTIEHHEIRDHDAYLGLEVAVASADRAVLDVPEPWRVIPHLKSALRGGGALAIYVPTVVQMSEAVEKLYEVGGFTGIEAGETLARPWKVTPQSIRPEQRIVGHTGFVVYARRAGHRQPSTDAATASADNTDPHSDPA